MDLEKNSALPPTDEQKEPLGNVSKNVENVVKDQLDAKSAPINYMTQPREERDAQADKFVKPTQLELLRVV